MCVFLPKKTLIVRQSITDCLYLPVGKNQWNSHYGQQNNKTHSSLHYQPI